MKRKVGFLLLAVVFLAGCGLVSTTKPPDDPYAYSAYGALVTAMTVRDMAMDFVGGLYKVKQVSEEKWKAINALDDKFLDSYIKAAKAISDYKKGLITIDMADLAMKAMQKTLDELKEYYAKQIPADGKPLIN